jgi:CRISPR-associated endonuclease Csn1
VIFLSFNFKVNKLCKVELEFLNQLKQIDRSSSIGWAIRENNSIILKGVITFQSGMTKGQTGGYTSPTKDRRETRSKRRLIQSRKYRKWQLLKILLNGFVPLDEIELENWSKYKKGGTQRFPESVKFLKWLACDFTYLENGIKYKNPYELRVKALDGDYL